MAIILMPRPTFSYPESYLRQVVAAGYHSLGLKLSLPSTKAQKSSKNTVQQYVDTLKQLGHKDPAFVAPQCDEHTKYDRIFWAANFQPENLYDNTISLTTLVKMGLVKGSGETGNEKESLVYRISTAPSPSTDDKSDRKSLFFTEAGKYLMIKEISQPHATATVPLQNQKIIKEFATNKKLNATITEILQKIGGKNEMSFLAYYDHSTLLDPYLTADLYSTIYPLNMLNDNPQYLTVKSIFDRWLKVHDIAWTLAITYSLTQVCKNSLSKKLITGQEVAQNEHAATTTFNNTFLLNNFTNAIVSTKNIITQQYEFVKLLWGKKLNAQHPLLAWIPTPPKELLVVAGFGICADRIIKSLASIKKQEEIFMFLQSELMNVADYIKGAQELYKQICLHPEIAQNFTKLNALENLVNPINAHSAEFTELIELLSTETFKGKPSPLSVTGRITRAHSLMMSSEVRSEFTDIVNAIGKIDVYLTLANKINASANQEARYSFVTFDTTSKTPYIKATGIWNPFVSENKAVTNSIEFGLTKPRNIVLSGPNTGGKSTIAKATLLNAILAQTFGIAAAESMIMTPFANLDCYLNMTDDTAGGVSGLKAEVDRAKAIIEKINATKGFSFILLDEIFTATSPDQAEKIAVQFITKLSQYENTLFMNCAHFDGIMSFAEQSPNCKNYHMGAVIDANGKVSHYTYKLNEGRSRIKNAAQVAQEAFSF